MADILLSRHTASGDLLEVGEVIALEPTAVPPADVPKPIGPLYGYAEEGAALQAAIGQRAPSAIGICGPSGVGKTEFLVRALLLGREAWPDGHVFLSVRNLGAADIIALLSDVVFAIEAGLRPPMAVCIAALSERRLIVGLDDLRSAQDLAVLRSALPRSMLCFASSEQWVTGDVAWIPLRGLKGPEGVAFVRTTAGRDVSDDVATRVVANLEGNPSRILRAIGGGLDLGSIATGCLSPEAFDKLQCWHAQQELSVKDAVALAAIATFGRAALGAKSPRASLVKRCLVERSSVGWSVPAGLRQQIAWLSIDPAAVAASVFETVPPEGMSDPYAALDCAAGLPTIMSRGGAVAQRLAGVVCRALDRRGLWDVSTALYRRLYAMRDSLDDREMRAWVVHQLATRLACAGEVDTARDLFTEALAAESDAEATAVTAANLARLPRKDAVELPPAVISSTLQHLEAAASGRDDVTVEESAVASEKSPALGPLSAIVRPALPRARRDDRKAESRVVVGATIALAGVAALGLSSVLPPPASSKLPPTAAMTRMTATTKPPHTEPKNATGRRLLSVGPTATPRLALPGPRSTGEPVATHPSSTGARATPHATSRKAQVALWQAPPQPPSFRRAADPHHKTLAAAATRTRSAARVTPAHAPATTSPVRASSHPTVAPYVVVLAPMAPIASAGSSTRPTAESQPFADALDPAAAPSPQTRHGHGRHHRSRRNDAAIASIVPTAPPSAPPAAPGRSQPFTDALDPAAARSSEAANRLAAESRDHRNTGPQPNIMPFTVLPESIARGSAARLCVSASRADTLYVSGLGNFDPQQTNCRTVKPAKTTIYVARATNQAGQSAERALILVVR